MPTPIPIYGYKPQKPCNDLIDLNAIIALETLIVTLSDTIEEIYPNISLVSPDVATMSLNPSISPAQFVRLKWISRNEGIIFTASLEQCYELAELYLSIGVTNWKDTDSKLVSFFAINGINL